MTDLPQWLDEAKAAKENEEGTPAEIEVLPADQCVPEFSCETSLRSTTPSKSWKSTTPTRRVYKYPPASDNPGRVSAGTAEHLRKQAEAHHAGTQWEALAALRFQRPSKSQRRARRKAL